MKRIRSEAAGIISSNKDTSDRFEEVNIDITKREEKCPILHSSFKEAIRLGNQIFEHRYAIRDATVKDENGTEYLLRKGVDVMWSIKSMHRLKDCWPEATDFRPERFLPTQMDHKQQQSYVPFGGGKHLCPGRYFAVAEVLGLIIIMVVGFEVDGPKPTDTEIGTPAMTVAIPRPSQGSKMKFRRKSCWENVRRCYKCE